MEKPWLVMEGKKRLLGVKTAHALTQSPGARENPATQRRP